MQIVINIIFTFSVIYLVSQSFAIIYYPTKFFNLSHAAIITLAAYLVYMFYKQIDLSLWQAIGFSIILSTIVGLLLEVILFKPLRRKNRSSLILLISSLGVYVILQNVISVLWGDNTKSIRSSIIKTSNKVLDAHITDTQIMTIISSLVILVVVLLFFKHTKIGKNLRSISENEELSNIWGINSHVVTLCAVGFGSLIAASAGVLVAIDTNLIPTMGFSLLLYGIVAMIVGGVGSTWGLVGGSLLLATAQHFGAYYIDSKWIDAIAYIILILFLIWRPLGFSGKQLKKMEI